MAKGFNIGTATGVPYVGTSRAKKVFRGTELIWQDIPPSLIPSTSHQITQSGYGNQTYNSPTKYTLTSSDYLGGGISYDSFIVGGLPTRVIGFNSTGNGGNYSQNFTTSSITLTSTQRTQLANGNEVALNIGSIQNYQVGSFPFVDGYNLFIYLVIKKTNNNPHTLEFYFRYTSSVYSAGGALRDIEQYAPGTTTIDYTCEAFTPTITYTLGVSP